MKAQSQGIKMQVEQLRSSLNNGNSPKFSMPVTQNLFDGKSDKTLVLTGGPFNDRK